MAKKAGLPIKKAEGSTKPVPVKIVHDTAEVAPSNKNYEAEERKRKAKYALEDIERAEGHKKDRALMKDVKSLAKSKIKSMQKIC